MNRALIVAINSYPGSPLRGCLNDAEAIKEKLVEMFGFSPLHIHTLTDAQATRDAILVALRSMVNQANEGDRLVFHYSGHGSQVPDCDGDEADGLDEIVCPYDFNWQGTYISDDDLRRVLGELRPGATLDVILDCCHSGTGLRDGDRSRCIPYLGPVPITRGWHPKHLLKGLDMGNVALWAGCRSNQTSADAYIDGKYQGP